MRLRIWSVVVAALLPLHAQKASGAEHFVLSPMGGSQSTPSGQAIVSLTLRSAPVTDLFTTSQTLPPVAINSYVTGAVWELNNWRQPVSEILKQSSAEIKAVQVDVQIREPMDVSVSRFLVKADNVSLAEVDVSLSFGKDALAGLTGLALIHLYGMKTTFEDRWLPNGVDLNQLMVDKATVDSLELETSVKIKEVVIRQSNLSFPTAVLGLDTAVTTLILEQNTFAGPIELTENEYTQLSTISDFRAWGNIVDTIESKSCLRKETIRELEFCIIIQQSSATTENSGSLSSSSEQSIGPLETQSAYSPGTRRMPITTIAVVSACVVGLVVMLAFFRRFKKKVNKDVDVQLTFTNREAGLLVNCENEKEKTMMTTDAKLLADMDLGKDQVMLQKKLGIQNLWLGEYKQMTVVVLMFLPGELDMSLNDLNAVRMSYVPLRHPNLVHFLGTSWTDREEVLLVVEHMPKGSLRAVLADTQTDLAWPLRLGMSKDICCGLSFVRSIQGMHLSRNLTARSVLVDATFTCKLDIFDYAWSLRTNLVPVLSFGNGDIASRAPELLKGEEITAASEVYALGVLFCEISSQRRVFESIVRERGPTLGDIYVATEVVAQRLQPSVAEDAPAAFRDLVLSCLCYEPSERLQLSEVLSRVSGLNV
ncbi:hypothetical protein PsorP6_000395 [Peronosclerospora sorghi]|uniref:Uncharacterized protein n=1 Tax=Peronosclerospora sorghi TaxID=230839 RepID=A0ACC0WSQ0_9STRA|nr:hypothetical protein PsorP6_000395 [Peronosclerospora sorghi]